MANAFSNPTVVAKEALRHLKNNCVMGRLVHRGYEEEFKKRHNGWNQGDSITVNAPVYFRSKTGRTVDTVDLKRRKTTYTVDQWKHVAWALNAEEMTLDLDKWSKDYLAPAMQALANTIDVALLALYKGPGLRQNCRYFERHIPAGNCNPGHSERRNNQILCGVCNV